MSETASVPPTPSSSAQELGAEDRVEVTAFLERKTWIKEKIKLLEAMPPIDVFAGVEHILPTTSTESIPGLPTRQEVAEWLADHQKIESETEQFDKGDMIRLKKLAKAKSEQNLSPEDTDLIEITLDTLFSLDKLMHLLRSRRDSIEQMGLRIKWEDLRIGAWKDRRAILTDVDQFVKAQARWSPAVYDELGDVEPSSEGSTPPSFVRSPTSKFLSLARSARYKHSEALSREAAAYASRVLGFHNNWITPSGHALDKLIERRTVPDQLLDEQDRLEDQTKELDQVAKFPMTLVMQWKKADELYGELKKDQASARQLRQELEKALEAHPRSRLDEEFVARSSALNTRLSQISDPVTSRSFPRPMNARYPDQRQSNEALATLLSTELRGAIKTARLASILAKQYHTSSEAVKKIRKLNGEMAVFVATFGRITDRLTNGTGPGDGSPPDIDTPDSLDPLRHSAFFALLPSVVSDLETNVREADFAVRETRTALLTLASAALEPDFKSDTEAMIQRVEEGKALAMQKHQDVQRKADLLRDARNVSDAVRHAGQDLTSMRERVLVLVDRHRWKAERGRDGAPLTPDSPTQGLPVVDMGPSHALKFVNDLAATVQSSIIIPCATLIPSLGPSLASQVDWMKQDLVGRMDGFKDLVLLWEDVRRQAEVMGAVRDETHALESSVEDTRSQLQSRKTQILNAGLPVNAEELDLSTLSGNIGTLRDAVERFTSSLSSRITFVTRVNPPRPSAFEHLPFNPSTLDHAVKTDVNAFAMSLAGGVESLNRNMDVVKLAIMAKAFDCDLETTSAQLQRVEDSLTTFEHAFEATADIAHRQPLEEALQKLREEYDAAIGDSPSSLRRRLSVCNQLVSDLENAPGAQDVVCHDTIVLPRKRALSNVSQKSDVVIPKVQLLNEMLHNRTEAAILGRKLEDAMEPVRQELTHVQELLEGHLAHVSEMDLATPDAASQLVEVRQQVDEVVLQHVTNMKTSISNLKSTRDALTASVGYRDPIVVTVMQATMAEAAHLEGSQQQHASLTAQIHNTALEQQKVVDAARALTERTTALRQQVDGMTVKLTEASGQLEAVHYDPPSLQDLQPVQDSVTELQTDHDQNIIPTIRPLAAEAKTFCDHVSAKHSNATNLVGVITQHVQETTQAGLGVQTQLSEVSERLTTRRRLTIQAIAADTALQGANDSMNDASSQLDVHSATYQALLVDGAETIKLLPVVRGDSVRLVETLDRAVNTTVQQASSAVEGFESLVTSLAIDVPRSFVGMRRDSLQTIQARYSDCVQGARQLSSAITELEAREAQRAEETSRKAQLAERERVRLLQEEEERARAEAAAARDAELEEHRRKAEEEVRRVADETAKREEVERQARLAAESETKRITEELARMRLAEDSRLKAEEEASAQRAAAAKTRSDELAKMQDDVEDSDVFSIQVAPGSHQRSLSQEESDLRSRVANLRTQLRSLALHSIVRPPARPSSSKQAVHLALPLEADMEALFKKYDGIVASAAKLPARIADPASQAELQSLQFEIEGSSSMVTRIKLLARFSSSSTSCDNALSDILEHLDSYPSPPLVTSSSHVPDSLLSPEAQLSNRVGFTAAVMESMRDAFKDIADDERVTGERGRLEQTWSELYDMSMDKINNMPSRPPSSIRTPSESGSFAIPDGVPKQASYHNLRRSRASSSLSVSSNNGSRPTSLLADANAANARTLGRGLPSSRSTSRISNRSVSGPIAGSSKAPPPPVFSPGVYAPTFSSRQRTMSNSSMASNSVSTPKRTTMSRPRIPTDLVSPGGQDVASPTASGSKSAFSTWGRTPKSSLSNSTTLPRSFRESTPSRTSSHLPVAKKRKEYIPNQKHRVDVAVAKVINDLDPDVQVNIEPISWKDQSGKYWIGDKDPKLCFCRILRSQTVMVRVGGGWVELSKFLRGHYDLFRVAPPPTIPGSPPREEEEQRWISSATLLAAAQASASPVEVAPRSPSTPEPRRPQRVSLSPLERTFGSPLSPGRSSPLGPSPGRRGSLANKTQSPHGSPLMPIQFLRRAEDNTPPGHLTLPIVTVRPTTPTNPRRSLSSLRNADPTSPVSLARASQAGPASRAPRWRL